MDNYIPNQMNTSEFVRKLEDWGPRFQIWYLKNYPECPKLTFMEFLEYFGDWMANGAPE